MSLGSLEGDTGQALLNRRQLFYCRERLGAFGGGGHGAFPPLSQAPGAAPPECAVRCGMCFRTTFHCSAQPVSVSFSLLQCGPHTQLGHGWTRAAGSPLGHKGALVVRTMCQSLLLTGYADALPAGSLSAALTGVFFSGSEPVFPTENTSCLDWEARSGAYLTCCVASREAVCWQRCGRLIGCKFDSC